MGAIIYYNGGWRDFTGQGYTVREYESGKFRVEKNALLIWTAGYIRSLFTSSVVLFAAFGPELYSNGRFLNIFPNAYIKLFARQWFDKWLADVSPRRMLDGTYFQGAGQLSRLQTTILSTIFEFALGMVNNLDLLFPAPPGDPLATSKKIFMASAGLGIVKLLWDNRYELRGMAAEVPGLRLPARIVVASLDLTVDALDSARTRNSGNRCAALFR